MNKSEVQPHVYSMLRLKPCTSSTPVRWRWFFKKISYCHHFSMDILRISKPNRKWYEIVIWWELRRIPYNIIMCFVGLTSFYVGHVTIPLVYILIGLLLNVGYTFCWIVELIFRSRIKEHNRIKYPKTSFISYLVISSAIIVGISLLIFIW